MSEDNDFDPMSGACNTCGYTLAEVDLYGERETLRAELAKVSRDRDHADMCLKQATSMLDGKSKEIERLQAELEKQKAYTKGLEDDYSRQGLDYRAKVDRLIYGADRVIEEASTSKLGPASPLIDALYQLASIRREVRPKKS